MIERPRPTRVPGPGVPRGQDGDNAITGMLVVLGVGAALMLVGLQVAAWFF